MNEETEKLEPIVPTVITITLPIRLDYLGFITQFDDSENFIVSVENGMLIIKEVLPS